MKDGDLPAYSRRLKAALALRGWTMLDLAESIPPNYRLSRSTLEKIGRGVRPPQEYEYPLLAELLDVPEWFLRDGLSPLLRGSGGEGEQPEWLLEARRLRDLLEDVLSQEAEGRP